MPDPTTSAVLIATALIGSTIGGVAGFGAGVLLLPVLAWTMGVRAAVPILTVTMFLGNLSRVWWSRQEMDGGVVARFLCGAVPATIVGAILYAGARAEWLGSLIGAFLISAVPLRRLLARGHFRVRLAHFPALGGLFGFLSALVATTGPIVSPFFLAYGLRRGAYIATEAACALGMHLTRGIVFARYALLTWDTLILGVVLGSTMFLGSWAGRRLIERMSERLFLVLIEALLIVMGLKLLLSPG
jgi:hypothetical protein